MAPHARHLVIRYWSIEVETVSTHAASQMAFKVLPGRSAVLVKARSTVGPISFGTTEVEGTISTMVKDGAFDTNAHQEARLEVQLNKLTSGNRLYDDELRRRIDARRYPLATIDLRSAAQIGKTDRYELTGEIEFHNIIREIAGTVSVDYPKPNTVVIRGEQIFDIREFNLEVPTTFMLKIYPDVWVELHLEARAE
jgi:polyisoprenoid-binding protein YceI